MDLEMPLLDGISATRQIKAAYPAARVLVLTVHDRTEDRALALQAGADGFLVKGAPVTDIIHEINRIMRSNP
jgi:DNA-binding NarL/FixJ family response regulator